MTILWLAALSRLSANGNIILDLRRKIRDQIAAVATWKGGSPLLTKFSPSVSGSTRVAWTGTIPFKEIPPTDVIVYFLDASISMVEQRLGRSDDGGGATDLKTEQDGRKIKPIHSLSEVFIDRCDRVRSLGLFTTSPRVDEAAAVLGGAALHEAMHNKISNVRGELFGRFDLHAQGGGGVAAKGLEKQSTGVGLMTKNPTFKIITNSTNRTLWNADMGKAVKQNLRGTDFEREMFLFR